MQLRKVDPNEFLRAVEAREISDEDVRAEIRAFESHRDRMRSEDLYEVHGWNPRQVNEALDGLWLKLGQPHGAERAVEGVAGGALLRRLVDDAVTEDKSRRSIIESMTTAAGFDSNADDPQGTTNEIINGSIGCPPVRRLEGFARALGTSVGRLRTAFESDGCSYG